EEIAAGPRNPLTGLRRRSLGRNMPRRRECAEMIESHCVDVSEQRAQAVDAPGIAAGGQRVPVVDRIAPSLPLCAEVVGRHTGDDTWSALRVEQEQLRIRPDVARVR